MASINTPKFSETDKLSCEGNLQETTGMLSTQ